MKAKSRLIALSLMTMIGLGLATVAMAQPPGYGGPPWSEGQQRGNGWVHDVRHGHDQYYPRRGGFVRHLPADAITVQHGGARYFYERGIWYGTSGSRYVVVSPPLGLVVPVLPGVYATLRFGPRTYYYANDVYYTPVAGGFAVSAPPPQSFYTPLPAVAAPPAYPAPGVVAAPAYPAPQWVIYPRRGQGPGQTAADRRACEQWAMTQPGAQEPSLFARGMSACMDARGYSIR